MKYLGFVPEPKIEIRSLHPGMIENIGHGSNNLGPFWLPHRSWQIWDTAGGGVRSSTAIPTAAGTNSPRRTTTIRPACRSFDSPPMIWTSCPLRIIVSDLRRSRLSQLERAQGAIPPPQTRVTLRAKVQHSLTLAHRPRPLLPRRGQRSHVHCVCAATCVLVDVLIPPCCFGDSRRRCQQQCFVTPQYPRGDGIRQRCVILTMFVQEDVHA